MRAQGGPGEPKVAQRDPMGAPRRSKEDQSHPKGGPRGALGDPGGVLGSPSNQYFARPSRNRSRTEMTASESEHPAQNLATRLFGFASAWKLHRPGVLGVLGVAPARMLGTAPDD